MHQPQVDHQAALTHGVTGRAVTTAANRERQPRPAREIDRRRDVVGTRAASDHRRPAISQRIESRAGDVVSRIIRSHHRPAQPAP
jgi:hypothetical protein